jgi:integrase
MGQQKAAKAVEHFQVAVGIRDNLAQERVQMRVSEAIRLLLAAHISPELELVPYLAIGLFAGLRAAEIEKLDWSRINRWNRTIEVTAENSKTGRNRLVEISDNLFAWLQPCEKFEGRVAPMNFYRRKDQLLELAEITKWPDNGLRHSFGTYHYAFHQNAPKTAAELGHESTKMLFKHYRKPVTKAEAAEFWNIMPPKGWLKAPLNAQQEGKPTFHGRQEHLKKLIADKAEEIAIAVLKTEQAAA